LEKSLTVKKRSALTEKNIYITRVTAFWLHGDLDRATDAITEVEKRYEYLSASALTTFGFIYILKGDLQKAAELTEKALADNADYSSAWDNLGQIKFRQEDFTEAKQAFEKAVLLNPRMSDSLYYIALIEIKDGNIETAKKYLSQALECNITTFNTVSREEIENTQKNLEI
jgi:tetratricopeptide (TPR) repeat protein